MTKKEAVSLVRESAEFWRAEEIRHGGIEGLKAQTRLNLDGISCMDPEIRTAIFVLGESEFLREFNAVYMR